MEEFIAGVVLGGVGLAASRFLWDHLRARPRRLGADGDRTSGVERYQRMKRGE